MCVHVWHVQFISEHTTMAAECECLRACVWQGLK